MPHFRAMVLGERCIGPLGVSKVIFLGYRQKLPELLAPTSMIFRSHYAAKLT